MAPVVLSTIIHGADEFEAFPLREFDKKIVIRQKKKLKGPSRVVRLCFLGILFPTLLVAVPLYFRYKIYRHQLYPLTTSDMRIIDGRISTMWCQRQILRANTTFNAYLLPDTPKLSGRLENVSMVRHLLLEDDMKEYWGFYLLKGSLVKVSTCARWPGASLIVIRGHKHLHECAYIGDNSSEELAETEPKDDGPANKPEEMRRHRPEVQFLQNSDTNIFIYNNSIIGHSPEFLNDDDTSDAEGDIEEILDNLQNKTRKSKQEYHGNARQRHGHRNSTIDNEERKNFKISSPSLNNLTSDEVVEEIILKLNELGSNSKNILDKLNKKLNKSFSDPSRGKRELLLETAENLFQPASERDNVAKEEGFQADGIADHRGRVFEMPTNDMSNSEFWSSFSSSEEALLSCTGLILNLPLTPHHKCSLESSAQQAEEINLMNTIAYKVPINGYYFFVFNSENEVQQNYLRVTFNIEKKVYDVSNYLASCSNVTGSCVLDLKFLSQQKVVLQLPQHVEDIDPNMEFVAESECEPRSMLYAFFVIAVPVVFILFAFT